MKFIHSSQLKSIPADAQILGIEVPPSMPAVLERCNLGNIDPQHTDGRPVGACLEMALQKRPLPEHCVLVTPRIDLDAVAAMAIAKIDRDDPEALEEYPYDPGFVLKKDVAQRLHAISRADSFAYGKRPGPRPMPTIDAPWADKGAPNEVETLAAVSWVCGWATPAGGKLLTLAQSVEVVGYWLLHGETTKCNQYKGACVDDLVQYAGDFAAVLWIARQEATRKRIEMVSSLHVRLGNAGQRELNLTGSMADDELACELFLTDTTRGDGIVPADIGYRIAPVTVFHAPDGRWSIAAWDTSHIDFPALKSAVNALEPGWGGPPSMCNSPMGKMSELGWKELKPLVAKFLK